MYPGKSTIEEYGPVMSGSDWKRTGRETTRILLHQKIRPWKRDFVSGHVRNHNAFVVIRVVVVVVVVLL